MSERTNIKRQAAAAAAASVKDRLLTNFRALNQEQQQQGLAQRRQRIIEQKVPPPPPTPTVILTPEPRPLLPPLPQQNISLRYTVLEALSRTIPLTNTTGQCTDFDDLKLSELELGHGRSSTTYQACYKENCQQPESEYKYAVKIANLGSPTSQRLFRMEAILAMLGSEQKWGPKIISAFTCENKQKGVLVMPLLRPVEREDLQLGNVQKLAALINRINTMHEMGILHGDLYMHNIMVVPETKEMVIVGLGLALITKGPVPLNLRASDVVSFLYGMPYPWERDNSPVLTTPSTGGFGALMTVLTQMVSSMSRSPSKRLTTLHALPGFQDINVLQSVLTFYLKHYLKQNQQALIEGAQMRLAQQITSLKELFQLKPPGPYSMNVKMYYTAILQHLPEELITSIIGPAGILQKCPWTQFTLNAQMEQETDRMLHAYTEEWSQKIGTILKPITGSLLPILPLIEPATQNYFAVVKSLETIPLDRSLACTNYSNLKVSDIMLGSGSYGTTFKACYDTNCRTSADYKYAVKVVKLGEKADLLAFRMEAILSYFAGQEKWGPEIVSFFTCDSERRGIIVMQLLRPVDEKRDFSPAKVKNLITRMNEMHEAGILHGDLFLRNLMMDPNSGEILMIDYGLALLMQGPVPLSLRVSDFAGLIYGMPMPYNEDLPDDERLIELAGAVGRRMTPDQVQDLGMFYLHEMLQGSITALEEGLQMRLNKTINFQSAHPVLPPGRPPFSYDVELYYKTILENLLPSLKTVILGPVALDRKFPWVIFSHDRNVIRRTSQMLRNYLAQK